MRRLAILVGPRARVLLAIILAGVWAGWQLGLDTDGLVPSSAGWTKASEFFAAALAPAWDYEDPPPKGSPPFLLKVAGAAWHTVAFAVAAVSLSLGMGLVLGVLASSAWWEDDLAGGKTAAGRMAAKLAGPMVVWSARAVIVAARSVHELLWAVLFLCAMGLNSMTAILAIAIPYTGVLAKVFSEMLDETPRDSAYALRCLGASRTSMFLLGLFPRALPDLTAYACYRLECGLRSSAVMGFFGIPTIGYFLKPSFDELHYHEVWAYLYALLALIVVADIWSSRIRGRLVR